MLQVATGQVVMRNDGAALPTWSPDERAFTASLPGQWHWRVFDVCTRAVLCSAPAGVHHLHCVWAPDSRLVLCRVSTMTAANRSGLSLRVLDARRGAILHTLPYQTLVMPYCFSFSPDSRMIAAHSQRRWPEHDMIHIHDAQTGASLLDVPGDGGTWHPSSQFFSVCLTRQHQLCMYSVASAALMWVKHGLEHICILGWDSTGRILALSTGIASLPHLFLSGVLV